MVTFFSPSLQYLAIILPTLVLPVNVTFRTDGCLQSLSLTLVEITFKTPFGNPACRARSAKARMLNGASGEGLKIMEHPAARTMVTLRMVIATGKFHGTRETHTPTR
jgi:hypothetical protein